MVEDKSKIGIPTSRDERHMAASAYIDVHRNRILEDGYVQLSSLNSRLLKGTIKVKFINEQVCQMFLLGRKQRINLSLPL